MMILKWFGVALPLIVSSFNYSLSGVNGEPTATPNGEPPNDWVDSPGLPHGGFVGINIGDSDMVDPKVTVDILKANNITHVRLFDADARMLNAFANTSIEVIVGIRNEEIQGLAKEPGRALGWIIENVGAYPWVNITAIALGNEVLSSHDQNATEDLLAAFKILDIALTFLDLKSRVKVSAPQSIGLIRRPFPPSLALFDFSISSEMNELIFFYVDTLNSMQSCYMLNAYPYYDYSRENGTFSIDYALFRPFPSAKQIVDPNTHLYYNNMLDVMIDATYHAMAALGYPDIPIVVTETGWPWLIGAKEVDATKENAETFNKNLVRRVLNGSRGTPGKPSIPVRAYIFELFNGGGRIGKWGLFSDNGAAVYPLSLKNFSSVTGNSSIFCVAKQNVDSNKMKSGLDWVCAQGLANCTAIQKGQPCYFPNTHKDHASFAYNDYFQRTGKQACDFNGTAVATTIDPSYGACIFNGSTNMIKSTGLLAPAPAPVAFNGSSNMSTGSRHSGPTGGSTNLKVSRIQWPSLISVSFLALVFL